MKESLWGGRFQKGLEHIAAEYNQSIHFDHILFRHSIKASQAHVMMLAKQQIISQEEREMILEGLKKVESKLEKEEIIFDILDEDIMMTIERNLIAEIGDVGKKLHTARSRNDQNVVDEKLFLKAETSQTVESLLELLEVLIQKAETEGHIAMPGFTHLQHAQPITTGFYYMAHFQSFRRDVERFLDSYKRLNINPLGACAMAGTTLPIDRMETTRLLNFAATTENAMDTAGDRDFIAEYVFNAALCMVHLSRFAEEVVVFNSQEFSFIDIDDSFCTGSSIMPQKKNPDIAELVRGKSARSISHVVTILTMLKGTFLTLNKDYQEDKETLFDSIKTLNRSIHVFSHMLERLRFKEDILKEQLKKGFITATDIAEYLVQQNIPFREAHELVGQLVKYCEIEKKTLDELTEEELDKMEFPVKINPTQFSIKSCIEKRESFGGTGPKDVQRQISSGKDFVKMSRDFRW